MAMYGWNLPKPTNTFAISSTEQISSQTESKVFPFSLFLVLMNRVMGLVFACVMCLWTLRCPAMSSLLICVGMRVMILLIASMS